MNSAGPCEECNRRRAPVRKSLAAEAQRHREQRAMRGTALDSPNLCSCTCSSPKKRRPSLATVFEWWCDCSCLFSVSLSLCGKQLSQERLQSTARSEEHTSELQSQSNLVCRLLLEKKKQT